MNTGIARKIDDLGRIVIPAEFRRLFGINEGDELMITTDGGEIRLRKVADTCIFCGSHDGVVTHRGKGICRTCHRDISHHPGWSATGAAPAELR